MKRPKIGVIKGSKQSNIHEREVNSYEGSDDEQEYSDSEDDVEEEDVEDDDDNDIEEEQDENESVDENITHVSNQRYKFARKPSYRSSRDSEDYPERYSDVSSNYRYSTNQQNQHNQANYHQDNNHVLNSNIHENYNMNHGPTIEEELEEIKRKRKRNREEIYEQECGYWLVKLFRGKSFGRIVKRRLLRYCIIQISFGMILLIIAGQEKAVLPGSVYLNKIIYGASLQSLMYFASIPSFLLGNITIFILSYWQSLNTNILLFVKIMKIYLCIDIVALAGIIWCTCVLFLTFAHISSWNANSDLSDIRPYYVVTIIFICPFSLLKIYNMSELSFLIEETSHHNADDEIDAPIPSMNLENMRLYDLLVLGCTMPAILWIRFVHFIESFVSGKNYSQAVSDTIVTSKTKQNNNNNSNGSRKGNKSMSRKIWKRMKRIYRRCTEICCVCYEFVLCCDCQSEDLSSRWKQLRNKNQINPSNNINEQRRRSNPNTYKLKGLTKQKRRSESSIEQDYDIDDLIESEGSNRIKPSSLNQLKRNSKNSIATDTIQDSKMSKSINNIKGLELDEVEKQQIQNESDRHSNNHHHNHHISSSLLLDDPNSYPNLTTPDMKVLYVTEFFLNNMTQFHRLWPSLPSKASFSCDVLQSPNIDRLDQHMRQYGFHIIARHHTHDKHRFVGEDDNNANKSNDNDIESNHSISNPSIHCNLFICNIRKTIEDSWFLTTFSFEESMKLRVDIRCSNDKDIPRYVQLFNLSKVLAVRQIT